MGLAFLGVLSGLLAWFVLTEECDLFQDAGNGTKDQDFLLQSEEPLCFSNVEFYNTLEITPFATLLT